MCLLAKNVILGGAKSVTLHDTEPAQLAELSSQVCTCMLSESLVIVVPDVITHCVVVVNIAPTNIFCFDSKVVFWYI